MSERHRVAFVEELGVALHRYGTPAHRLERALVQVAGALGIETRWFAVPTALLSVTQEGAGQRVRLARQLSGEVDLEKLVELDALAQAVVQGACSAEEGLRRLRGVLAAAPRFRPWTEAAASALAAATFAILFRAGAAEVWVAGLLGALVGLLQLAVDGRERFEGLLVPVGSFVVALIAGLVATGTALAVPVVTVAGVIALVPGLAVTRAASEVAQGSLVSGSARAFGALLVFLMLGFGAAAGLRGAEILAGPPLPAQPVPFSSFVIGLAVLAAVLAFGVMFRAAARDLLWMEIAALATYVVSSAAAGAAGAAAGAFAGAVVIGVLSNAYSRFLERPSLVLRVPGILLLVPGSIGFRSVSLLVADNLDQGVRSAFTVALIAVALTTGLLIANALVPPRRRL